MILTLERTHYGEYGTFGILYDEDVPLCLTLEDPWKNNKKGESCIPVGWYDCVPHNGTRFKNTWKLENVPGRSAIVIHAGNTQEDTRGCILVGRKIGSLEDGPAILESRAAMSFLRDYLSVTFNLEIKEFKPKLSWWQQLLKGA